MLNKKGIILVTVLVGIYIAATVCAAAAPANAMTYSIDKSAYIVKPSKSSGTIGIELVSGSVTQGQTNWHYKSVSSYMTTLNVDLNWGNSANSLQLTIYSPDNHVFGPYYDGDDGAIDGRINLDIYNPNGIARGTWSYKVYGYSVTGAQSYTI